MIVTHEARAASYRRPHPLHRRRTDRARPRPHQRRRGVARDGRAQPRVTKFALKGLLGRKLRTALTCIAIVLGVAMVTGTYILTDSIKGAFGGIFTEIYSGTDATITGKSAFTLEQREQHDGAAVRRVAARQGARAAGRRGRRGRRRRRGAPDRQERQGDRLRRRAEPRLQRRSRQARVQHPHADQRLVAVRERGRDRPVDGEEEGSRGRSDDRRAGERARAADAHLGAREVRRRREPRRRDARRLRPRDRRRSSSRSRGSSTRSARRRSRASSRSSSRARSSRSCRPATQVRTSDAQAQEDAKDTESFLNFLQDFLLAFGGIALFVGSFVIANSLSITIAQRTRELATLAHARRVAAAGAALDHGRVARDRGALVDRRNPRRARARNGTVQAVRRRRLHAAEQRARAAHAHDRRRDARRRPRDARREPAPRLPLDARAADRGGAGGRDAAAGALRPLPPAGRDRADAPRLRGARLRPLREGPRHDEDPRSTWASARC